MQLLSHVDNKVISSNDQERTPLFSPSSTPSLCTSTTRNRVLDSFPSSPIQSHSTQCMTVGIPHRLLLQKLEMDDGRYLLSAPAPPDSPLLPLRKFLGTLSSYMTLPLYAALTSALHLLREYARPIKGTVNFAGPIPITLVVLGALISTDKYFSQFSVNLKNKSHQEYRRFFGR
jgi:hypothetical protein